MSGGKRDKKKNIREGLNMGTSKHVCKILGCYLAKTARTLASEGIWGHKLKLACIGDTTNVDTGPYPLLCTASLSLKPFKAIPASSGAP